MDLVTHDGLKFFTMLLKRNGYVLEQLFSPLVVHTTPEHEELKEICRSKGIDTSPNSVSEPQVSGKSALTPSLSPRRGGRQSPSGEGGRASGDGSASDSTAGNQR